MTFPPELGAAIASLRTQDSSVELIQALRLIAPHHPKRYLEFFSRGGERIALMNDLFAFDRIVAVDPGDSVIFCDHFKRQTEHIRSLVHLKVNPAREEARPQALMKFVCPEGSFDFIFIDANGLKPDEVDRVLRLAFIYGQPRGMILVSGSHACLDVIHRQAVMGTSIDIIHRRSLVQVGLTLIFT